MKHKRILIIILILSIIFISYFYFISSFISHKYDTSYFNLISSTIDDISVGISQLEHSNNLYSALINLTEIKENSRTAVTLISYIEQSTNEFAIGDLLGYIYLYIDDIEYVEINEQLLINISDDLNVINTMFLKANTSFIKDKDEYFKLLVTELDEIIDTYPENIILDLYSNKKIP